MGVIALMMKEIRCLRTKHSNINYIMYYITRNNIKINGMSESSVCCFREYKRETLYKQNMNIKRETYITQGAKNNRS